MARSSNPSSPAAGAASTKNPLLELDRLLGRLDQNILKATSEQERRLRRDEFERAKARYDIQTARTLLTRLEQDALATKIHSRRQEVQADLHRKRDVVEQLLERVQDLEDIGAEDGDSGSEGEEDILADIILTPSESMDSQSADIPGESLVDDEREDGEAAEEDPPYPERLREVGASRLDEPPPPLGSSASPEEPGTTTSQTMRSRGKQPREPGPVAEDTAQTTSASARLFGDRTPASPSATATEEAILDSHRKEQEALSEDILRLAKALKDKSLTTSRLLEEDKDVLGRVGEGLDTTDRNMESASRSMSTLTRLTEGKGWWGRMLLFAMVYGMMLALVLLFLLLPKLRF